MSRSFTLLKFLLFYTTTPFDLFLYDHLLFPLIIFLLFLHLFVFVSMTEFFKIKLKIERQKSTNFFLQFSNFKSALSVMYNIQFSIGTDLQIWYYIISKRIYEPSDRNSNSELPMKI